MYSLENYQADRARRGVEAGGSFALGLSEEIERVLPDLKKGVNILLEGEITHHQSEENVLRGHVCGRAVRVLGYMLRERGYQAEGLYRKNLSYAYPTRDHALLRVLNPSDKSLIIVDPAYQQFVRSFYLEEELLPREEVMVLSETGVRSKAEEFARLRDLKLSMHDNPGIFKDHILFQLSSEQLGGYFEKIWMLDGYQDKTPRLEEDVEKYRRDKRSVSPATGKLVQYLLAR